MVWGSLVLVGPLGRGMLHLPQNMVYFPRLVLKGIYHYWKYVGFFSPGNLSKWKKRGWGSGSMCLPRFFTDPLC